MEMALMEKLRRGAEAKRLVDTCINRCSHMQNLRDAIAQKRGRAQKQLAKGEELVDKIVNQSDAGTLGSPPAPDDPKAKVRRKITLALLLCPAEPQSMCVSRHQLQHWIRLPVVLSRTRT